MAQFISITCAYCEHQWREDLEKHQQQAGLYKGGGRGQAVRTRLVDYHINCPSCDEVNIVDVQREV